jgi:hypothetical protein
MNDYVAKFHANDPEFHTDEKWWDLIVQGDPESPRSDSGTLSGSAGTDPFAGPNGGESDPLNDVGESDDRGDEDDISENRESDSELTQKYESPALRGISINVQAFKVLEGSHTDGFYVKLRGPHLEFHYWPSSPIFAQTLYTPADMLINELSVQLHFAAQREIGEIPISKVELSLRDKYFPQLQPSIAELKSQSEAFADELRQHLATKIENQSFRVDDLVSTEDFEKGKNSFLAQGITRPEDIERLFLSGNFLEGSNIEMLLRLVMRLPELAFDGEFFTPRLIDLAEAQKKPILEDFRLGMVDIQWLYENTPRGIIGIWRGRQLRARAALEIFRGWQE